MEQSENKRKTISLLDASTNSTQKYVVRDEVGEDETRDYSEAIGGFEREMSYNKIREINIRELDYGYLVNIGCQTFAISDADVLITKLTRYLNNPNDTEKLWNERKLF